MSFDALKAEMRERNQKDQSLHPARIGGKRADELASLFRKRLNALCVAAVKESKTVLTIEQAEHAALLAAEDLADTLRGRVRQRERERLARQRAVYEK